VQYYKLQYNCNKTKARFCFIAALRTTATKQVGGCGLWLVYVCRRSSQLMTSQWLGAVIGCNVFAPASYVAAPDLLQQSCETCTTLLFYIVLLQLCGALK